MILFISGVPGSGKTTFCRWLQQTHGYRHMDIEKDGSLQPLWAEWEYLGVAGRVGRTWPGLHTVDVAYAPEGTVFGTREALVGAVERAAALLTLWASYELK